MSGNYRRTDSHRGNKANHRRDLPAGNAVGNDKDCFNIAGVDFAIAVVFDKGIFFAFVDFAGDADLLFIYYRFVNGVSVFILTEVRADCDAVNIIGIDFVSPVGNDLMPVEIRFEYPDGSYKQYLYKTNNKAEIFQMFENYFTKEELPDLALFEDIT